MVNASQLIENVNVDSLLGILFGIFFILIYIQNREKLKRYRKKAIRTQGTVLDFDSGNTDTPFPIVEFQLQDGKDVAHKSSSGTNPPMFRKGEKVEILYLPEKPGDFIIISKDAQGFTIAFLIFGIMAITYSIYAFVNDIHFINW